MGITDLLKILFNPKVWIAIAAIVASIYIYSKVQDYFDLQETVKEQEAAIKEKDEKIEGLQRDAADVLASQKEIMDLIQQQGKSIDALRRKFSSLDLGKLAKENPKKAEEAIAEDYVTRLRCIELITGATPTQAEIDGKFIEKCK